MKNILTTTLLFLTVTLCMAQKKETISLKLEKGKTYIQDLVSDASINQSVMGQEMDMKVKTGIKMSFTVTDVTNGVYTLDTKYEKITMNMGLPTGDMNFDSESSNPGDMFAGVLAGLKTRGFTVKMNSMGKIVDVTGVENLLASPEFEKLPAEQKAQIKTSLLTSYGKENVSSNMETSTAIFPSTPVAVGDKWVINTSLASVGDATLSTTYELKGVTDTHYIISGVASLKPSETNAFKPQGPMEVKMNLSGSSKSDLKIDKKTGWISEGTTQQVLEGTSEIKANDQLPEGMKIPMKMSMVVTLKNN